MVPMHVQGRGVPAETLSINMIVLGLKFLAVVIFLTLLITQVIIHKQTRQIDIFKCRPDIVVSADGTGNFTRVSSAVAFAPNNSKLFFCILIRTGIYKENVVIPPSKTNIVLKGEGMNMTYVVSNSTGNSSDIYSKGKNATIRVLGDGFMAMDIAIENYANPNEEDAVALSIESDQAVLYRCNIRSNQHTVHFRYNKRRFFKECKIYGKHFLIFGKATTLFEQCTITVGQHFPVKDRVITSQMRWTAKRSSGGFVFLYCSIRSELEGAKTIVNNTYLGVASTPYSRVVMINSIFDGLINTAGWTSVDPAYQNTVYFGEFNNSGAGAHTKLRVRWPGFHVMKKPEVANFSVETFIQGNDWLPSTGVPYL